MPTNVSYDRDERCYIQAETSFGIVPNASGTATLAGSNAARHISMELMSDVTDLVREDKTGDRTRTPSALGRFLATWKAAASLVSNGTAGVAPDWDAVWAAVFGNPSALTAAGTATVSTCSTGANYQVTFTAAHGMTSYDGIWIPASAVGAPWGGFVVQVISATVVQLLGVNSAVAITATTIASRKCAAYTLGNLASKSFDFWRFVTPSTLRQEVAIGCVVSTFGVSAGGNENAKWSANGAAKWKLDSLSYADSIPDADQKGGLTSFPAEPGSPVTNGTPIPSFMGYIAMNGVPFPKVRSWGVNHQAGFDLPQEYIGTRYGQTPDAGDRVTTIDILLDDDDATGSQQLYELAQAKTTFDFIGVIGNLTQGNTFIYFLRGVQLNMPSTETTGRKFTRHYTGTAHGSGVATLDELKMIIV